VAVLTPLDAAVLESLLLQNYGLPLVAHQPISAGIENTNYFVDVLRDGKLFRGVLTLVETLPDPGQLSFMCAGLKALAQAGLPVPLPLNTLDHAYWSEHLGKPLLLQPRLEGEHIRTPGPHDCSTLGSFLARLHRVMPDIHRDNPRGPAHWRRVREQLAGRLPQPQQALLDRGLRLADDFFAQARCLPYIHADLFHDNLLMRNAEVSGVIDFYFACSGPAEYDLAIAINDWCWPESISRPSPASLEALLRAYQKADGPLPRFLKPALVAASLRFFCSRLEAWYAPDSPARKKDPQPYALRLEHWLDPKTPDPLQA
jgi:homoserine kinase type II